MVTKFTPEDLIQYLYHECSLQERIAIEQALESDWTLREKFEVLRKSALRLEKFTCAPRNESIRNIMQYAFANAVTDC